METQVLWKSAISPTADLFIFYEPIIVALIVIGLTQLFYLLVTLSYQAVEELAVAHHVYAVTTLAQESQWIILSVAINWMTFVRWMAETLIESDRITIIL